MNPFEPQNPRMSALSPKGSPCSRRRRMRFARAGRNRSNLSRSGEEEDDAWVDALDGGGGGGGDQQEEEEDGVFRELRQVAGGGEDAGAEEWDWERGSRRLKVGWHGRKLG